MDVISPQHTADDLNAFLAANLTANIAHPKADITLSAPCRAILARPDDVIATVENTVADG